MCPCYVEMDVFFGQKPNVTPIASYDSQEKDSFNGGDDDVLLDKDNNGLELPLNLDPLLNNDDNLVQVENLQDNSQSKSVIHATQKRNQAMTPNLNDKSGSWKRSLDMFAPTYANLLESQKNALETSENSCHLHRSNAKMDARALQKQQFWLLLDDGLEDASAEIEREKKEKGALKNDAKDSKDGWQSEEEERAAGFARDGGKSGWTQHRRVAAMSVANKMGIRVGDAVGYLIWFEDRTSRNTVIKDMTNAMLLRDIMPKPDFAGNSAMIASMNAVPGRLYPVAIQYTPHVEANYLEICNDCVSNPYHAAKG
ncbi:hypothetical protein O181_099681 [Austropuccinia psidii MF-1]|uniref:Uncharacterized protein n=1 Tax=Austropuccinia psidii MF-1 TaxID=1389203 RepID=A0A9Q3JDX3_9BASI|nr:hypothetical protein [Austropuccinia psidii MF-1]